MKFYLTKSKLEELREFFIGPKRIGDQYVLPLEFDRYIYLDELKRRTKLGSSIALLDLWFSIPVGIISFLIISICKKSIKYRNYILFDTNNRRTEHQVAMIDWDGNLYKDQGIYRQRTSLVKLSMEVSRDQLKTGIVEL